MYYAENVLPTNGGYKSISHTLVAPSPSPGTNVNSRVWRITDPLTGYVLYLYTDDSAARTLFVNKLGVYTAVANPAIKTVSRGGRLQNVFILNGLIHLSFAGDIGAANSQTVWTIDANSLALTAHALSGLAYTPDALHFSIAGYLCAISLTSVAWSSTLLIYDFTPSLLTGAGSIAVQDLQSSAVPVQAQGGAILVGLKNCVAMSFSNNARYPFTFQTITGSAGASIGPYDLNVPGQRYVGTAADSSGCYTLNDFTIQRVTLNSASPVFPEVSDFFDANELEDFNPTTYEITRAQGTLFKPTMIKTLFGRYIVVAYHQTVQGIPATFALVFDLQLKRVGRLKLLFDAADMIEWNDSIAYVTTNGAIYTADTNTASPHNGVLALGKFQYARTALLTLEAVGIESVMPADNFTCTNLPTLDGNTFLTPVVLYALPPSGVLRSFLSHTSGVNHTLIIKGQFDINTVEITYIVEGQQ